MPISRFPPFQWLNSGPLTTMPHCVVKSFSSCDWGGNRGSHSTGLLSLWSFLGPCSWSREAGVLPSCPEAQVCYLLPSAKRGRPGWSATENAMGNLRASKPWPVALAVEQGALNEYWGVGNFALSFAE